MAIGLCSEYVNELSEVYANPKGADHLMLLTNVSMICKKIENCYAQSNCSDVRKSAKSYKDKCVTFEFYYYKMQPCLSKFYAAVYKNETGCIQNYDFFSDDIDTKINAYRNGKQCFLDFANSTCSERENLYLHNAYENLIYLLTVDNSEADYKYYSWTIDDAFLEATNVDNNECSSLHNQLIGRQCELRQRDFYDEWNKVKYEKRKTTKDMGKMCEELKKCVKKYCIFKSNWAEMFCSTQFPTTKTVSESFDRCYVKIVTRSNVMNYPCVRKLRNWKRDTMESRMFSNKGESINLAKFLSDKACVKTVMQGECGKKALKNFDEEWARTQNETEAMKTRFAIN